MMNTMSSTALGRIVWLDDPSGHDRARVGGKASHLSRLAAHYQVPAAFCLTTEAWPERSASDVGTPFEMPTDMREEIACAYRLLGERCGATDPAVAVRSSAVDEDGGGASFAGQYTSYLNVTGVEALMETVTRCWASATSPHAQDYRRRQGVAGDSVRLAVLVQQLVPADASAVVFSANPVNGSREEVLITANWGLGESVVGGTATPDTYTVRKADLVVISRQVGEKRRMTVVRTAGGTEEVDVPRFLRCQATLSDEQAARMAHMALSLEQALGWPVDVECALRGGELYLLQCRPITTLSG